MKKIRDFKPKSDFLTDLNKISATNLTEKQPHDAHWMKFTLHELNLQGEKNQQVVINHNQTAKNGKISQQSHVIQFQNHVQMSPCKSF